MVIAVPVGAPQHDVSNVHGGMYCPGYCTVALLGIKIVLFLRKGSLVWFTIPLVFVPKEYAINFSSMVVPTASLYVSTVTVADMSKTKFTLRVRFFFFNLSFLP